MGALKNQIYVGSLQNPAFYFENDQISVCPSSQAVALAGQELSIDVFSPVVSDSEENLSDIYHFRSSDGHEIVTGVGQIYAVDVTKSSSGSDLINLEDGTPVWYYHNGGLAGKFYIDTVTRQARNKYKLNCTSAIGRLRKKFHGGGLFLASTFQTVLDHILASGLHGTGNPVIDYVIDDDVASLPVSGWFPYATKRDNLYRLIFANGVNIIKNWDGTPRFTFVYTAPEDADSILTSHIKNGGSVEYEKPYSKVTVMEHTYTPITEADPVTLFDNSIGTTVSKEEIWFDNAPIIVSTLITSGDLQIERDPVTLELLVSENSAVLSGNGVLTGIPYTHSTRSVSRSNPRASEEKTITIENCTTVNAINSENLLNRLFAFYCPTDFIKSVKNSIKFGPWTDAETGVRHDAQRCGKAYRFKNPYGEEETAFLASMDIVASSFDQASCLWYVGYEPAGQAGLYQHVVILDAETYAEDGGTFTVPDGVDEIKVVIIGGGTGGSSGWPGENGQDAYTHVDVESTADLSAVWYGAEGGDGGNGGAGGSPGRVKVVKIENPVADYSYTIGTGGEGGAHTGFIPDTADELRAALENEHPDTEYTAQEIATMIATEQSLSGWSGNPNPGTAGTASTFDSYSSADQDAYVPTGGVYEPITDQYFAIAGNAGIKGGKGGARKVKSGDTFNWITDGEDVTGDDGTVYRGGSTGSMLTDVAGLSEAAGKLKAYGGNGAGAAVGIGRDRVSPQTGLLLHPHINGGSDQETDWYIAEDE